MLIDSYENQPQKSLILAHKYTNKYLRYAPQKITQNIPILAVNQGCSTVSIMRQALNINKQWTMRMYCHSSHLYSCFYAPGLSLNMRVLASGLGSVIECIALGW